MAIRTCSDPAPRLAQATSFKGPSASWGVGNAVSRFVTQGQLPSVYAERPEYPCDPVALLQRYTQDDVSMPMLVWMAQQVLHHDGRFAHNHSPYLAAMRAMPLEPWAPQAVEQLEYNMRLDLLERLTDDMVALAQRPVTTVDNITQRFAHLSGGTSGLPVFSLTEDYAVGSLAAKHDRSPKHRYLRAYGANSAGVTQNGRLLLWRSGRSDTVPKLEEAVVGACVASLTAASRAGMSPAAARGMHRTARGLEFRPVILTAMDRSIMKGLYMRFTDGLSERAQLEAMLKARTALFGANTGTPYRTVQVRPEGAVQPFTVAVRMPPVVNVVLSWQSANQQQLCQARRENRPAGLLFMGDLVEAWSNAAAAPTRAVASILAHCQDEASSKKVLQALPRCPQYASLDARQHLALDWLMLTFTGQDGRGCRWLNREDPGKEIIFLKHLLDEIDALPAAQCKSGMDRTSLITGLLAASECHAARTGEPFDPRVQGQRLEDFRDSFTHIVNALCKPMLTLVRGVRGRIKWQESYVPHEYYRPHMEAGAPLGFASWEGDPEVEDEACGGGNLTWTGTET